MAHFALLWKARTIEKYRQNYENEKINSIIMSSSDVPDKTLFQRWRHYKHGMQKRLSRTFSKWYPEGSTVSNFFLTLGTDMKLPSILLRSFYGFLGGLLLTYLGFMFFVFQLSVSLLYATVLSSIIGVLLTLGLTFSNRMRCLILLLVPQLFSRVGRYTLTCYALVLILTGPATNTLKNSEVLSESMACSQEQIKLNVRQINDSIKKPFNAIKDSLKITVERMNLVVRKLKIAIIKANKLILSIASLIQSGYSWLGSVADVCDEALGTPRQRCLNILKESCESCVKHHNLNDMAPDNVKILNKHFVRDILAAIGVKNVKRRQEEDNFDAEFKKHNKFKDKNNLAAKDDDANNFEGLRKHNTANTDSEQFPSKEDNDNNLNEANSNKPWFCNTANWAESACASLQSNEKFCDAADFAGDTFLTTIRKKLKTFVSRMSALIHVQLNIQHTYTFIGNSSSSNQIAAGIITEIRNRADPILTWLSWSSCVTSLFLLLIFFRVKHYQHMFETRSRFDNRFITKEFRELDLKRLREGRETVLPLNTRERAKYVTTTSFRLVASEKFHLNRSAVFMTVATFKMLIHIVADYSLFWVLTTIQHHGKLHSPAQPGIADTRTVISGTGFVPRLLQDLVDTMNLQLTFPPDQSCLPNPHPPDIKRYCQIGLLIFLLWFFALFEPYGLRMRHLIMGHYRPQRAKDRAAWLYNHILRNRASFMKFARRKLHREYKYSSHSKFTLRQCLRNHAPVRWLCCLFGIKPDEPHCLLCNVTEDTSDHNKELIKCEVPNCPGTYCPGCFSDIGQLCTICLSPSDYGDMSDVSLEKGSDEGSSDDDNEASSGSYKRKSDYDSYTLEDANAEYSGYSRRSFSRRRQIDYYIGRIEKKGDTLPLIKHSVECNSNDKKQTNQSLTNGAEEKKCFYISVNEGSHKTTEQQIIKQDTLDNLANTKDVNNCLAYNIITTMNILLYSLYEITKNPLQIKISKPTTKIATYLRRRKLIRHKKCIAQHSKYFMSCSNNSINTNNENTRNGGDNNYQSNDGNNAKNNRKKNAKKDIINIELKCFHDGTEHENFGTKNETAKKSKKRHGMQKRNIHTALSKYWKNIVTHLDKSTTKTKEQSPSTEKKLKRRKKRKKTKLSGKGKDKLEITRLFNFLDEQNWVKCYDNNDDKAVHIVGPKKPMKYQKVTNEKVVVNNLMIPRLDLNWSDQTQTNTNMQISKSKSHAKHAIGKFIKSMTCSSCELFRSSTQMDNTLDNFYYNRASDSCLGIEEHEQDSITNAFPDPIHNVSPEKHISSKNARGFHLLRRSNPLLIIKTSCSKLFRNKIEAKIRDRKTTILNETETIHREMYEHEKPVENKTNQHKTKKRSNAKKSARTKNDADGTQNKEEIEDKLCDKEIQTMPMTIQTDDKEVTAIPLMISCGCQNLLSFEQSQDFGVQVKLNAVEKDKNTCTSKDAKVMTCFPISTCACAVQWPDGGFQDASTVISKKVGTSDSNLREENDSVRFTTESTVSDTDASKTTYTDTTVCSYANVGYCQTIQNPRKSMLGKQRDQVDKSNDPMERPYYAIQRPNYLLERQNYRIERQDYALERPNYRRLTLKDRSGMSYHFGKVKVITKSNQSTLTDKKARCDVSTTTNDWWSPLVEKKKVLRFKNNRPEKRRKDSDHPRVRERRTFKSTGISTGEKIVAFRSKTQFIPSKETVFKDIMSPSRYLLEDEKRKGWKNHTHREKTLSLLYKRKE